MFCTAKELELCPEGSFRRKLTRFDGCGMMPLQRVDGGERMGGKAAKQEADHKFGLGRVWV